MNHEIISGVILCFLFFFFFFFLHQALGYTHGQILWNRCGSTRNKFNLYTQYLHHVITLRNF